MKLTKEQNQKAMDKILKKWKNGCPKCHGTNITIFEKLYQLQEFQGNEINLENDVSVIPAVVTVCENCGDLSLFSSNFLKITG